MTDLDIDGPSPLPSWNESASLDDKIELMTEWFYFNFEPVLDATRGGPYTAFDLLSAAFPNEPNLLIVKAVSRIEGREERLWAASDRRVHGIDILPSPITSAEFGTRRSSPTSDPRAFTIVETVLYPKVTFQFSVRVTFIPGRTNLELGEELDFQGSYLATETGEAITTETGEQITLEDGADALVRRSFDTLRDLVIGLIDLDLEGTGVGALGELEAARDWVRSLESDSDLFVDDAIIVHASSPVWEPLAKLLGKGVEASSLSAVVFIADSPGKLTGLLLAYGGARVFVRLVHGVTYVQDAYFERLGDRIRRGDFDTGEKSAATARVKE